MAAAPHPPPFLAYRSRCPLLQVDLALESGEYFLSKEQREAHGREEGGALAAAKASSRRAEREAQFVPGPERKGASAGAPAVGDKRRRAPEDADHAAAAPDLAPPATGEKAGAAAASSSGGGRPGRGGAGSASASGDDRLRELRDKFSGSAGERAASSRHGLADAEADAAAFVEGGALGSAAPDAPSGGGRSGGGKKSRK